MAWVLNNKQISEPMVVQSSVLYVYLWRQWIDYVPSWKKHYQKS